MEIIAYAEYLPGLMSRIIEMQARYYYKFWNFGLAYEISVAGELAEFMSAYDQEKDVLLYALSEEKVIGSISINGSNKSNGEAQLRWFIMDDDYIGYGVGTKLMDHALAFCTRKNFRKVFLKTFKGLEMARNLYERNGFKLSGENINTRWGPPVIEEVYERLKDKE